MKINVLGLKKHFKKTKAVDGISFNFGSGDIFGFVGPNGAGKTTTMRIMATIDDATDGDIYFDDISAREYPEKIRKFVGFVPDLLPNHNDITVHEYLDFFARAYGLKGKERRSALGGVKEFTGLGPLQDKLLNDLSKGMKQRVSLGRALIHNPPVLVMDEPASGLDPHARIELRELLKILVEQKKAILISSHILSELTEICNGVVIIEKGKILETGTIEEVVTRGTPRRIIFLRPLEGLDNVHKELLQMPFMHSVTLVGKELRIEIDGTEEACSQILTDIIKRGYKIAEFRHQHSDLEDIFLKVTKGGVSEPS
ncbi:MAG: ABC transporter ATP-binding protein [Candidatus Aureabacteria bacterium]|nr:ABC transporter ATP-binding protein [Candidatus Auribacterota bacterium]